VGRRCGTRFEVSIACAITCPNWETIEPVDGRVYRSPAFFASISGECSPNEGLDPFLACSIVGVVALAFKERDVVGAPGEVRIPQLHFIVFPEADRAYAV